MRPNVIVFFTDQQRWDTVGAAGSPLGLTPNLDRWPGAARMFETALHPPTGLRAGPRRDADGPVPDAHRRLPQRRRRCPRMRRRSADCSARPATRPATSASGTSAPQDPVPSTSEAATTSGWRRTCSSSPPTPTDRRLRRGRPTGAPARLPVGRADRRGHPLRRPATSDDAVLPLPVVHRAAPPERARRLPGPRGLPRTRTTARWLPPDLATLAWYGAPARSPGTTARSSESTSASVGSATHWQSGPARRHSASSTRRTTATTSRRATASTSAHRHDGSVRVPLVVEGPGYRGGTRVGVPVSTWTSYRRCSMRPGSSCLTHLDGVPLRERTSSDGVLIQVSESEVGRGCGRPLEVLRPCAGGG